MDAKQKKPSKKKLNSNVKEFIPAPKPASPKKKSPKNSHFDSLIDLLLKMNTDYSYKNIFPRLRKYKKMEKIRETFFPLKDINQVESEIDMYKDADFFILDSPTHDDIHKSMKYGICSGPLKILEKISRSYKLATKERRRVVLFFRANKGKKFHGAAELTSDWLREQRYDYWWKGNESNGVFSLKWLFVKDLDLSTISVKQDEKKIAELSSGAFLSSDTGFYLVDMFRHINFRYDSSLFKFFELFDQREDYLIGSRMVMDVQIKLQKQEKRGREHWTDNNNAQKSAKKDFFNNPVSSYRYNRKRFSVYDDYNNGNEKGPVRETRRGKKEASRRFSARKNKRRNRGRGDFVYVKKEEADAEYVSK